LNVNIARNCDGNDKDLINNALFQHTNLTQNDIGLLLKSMPDYTSYIMTNINDKVVIELGGKNIFFLARIELGGKTLYLGGKHIWHEKS
jgi:hypothetical protein